MVCYVKNREQEKYGGRGLLKDGVDIIAGEIWGGGGGSGSEELDFWW